MKLYGTISSERATKGQGGNEYLRIAVTDEKQEEVMVIDINPDMTMKLYATSRVRLFIDGSPTIEKWKMREGNPEFHTHRYDYPDNEGIEWCTAENCYKQKGEKQKGECTHPQHPKCSVMCPCA